MISSALCLLAPVHPGAAKRIGVLRRTPAPGVVLTFDDGPHPEGTPAMLEILAEARAKAIFFVVGEQVRRRPELARRIVAEGHLVGVHAYRHRLQPRLSPRATREDLRRATDAVEGACGVEARWHRPPYGVYSPACLEEVLARGLRPLLWSRWGKDWRRLTTPARITSRATRRLAGGEVILLHDADYYSARGSHERTVAALPAIIGELNRRGLDTVLPV